MKVQGFQFNPVGENTYIAYDDSKECVIIDPGCFFPKEKETLTSFIEDNELKVKHILNTHLHFDHIFGNSFVEEKYGLETKAHEADKHLVTNLTTQLQAFGFEGNEALPPTIGQYLNEGDTIEFGKQKFEIFHVPGHSPGSIVFYNREAGIMFAGDVIFQGSIGRTDLESGDHTGLINGIKEKLFTLPAETIVYTGHGPSTSIGQEIKTNPFLQ